MSPTWVVLAVLLAGLACSCDEPRGGSPEPSHDADGRARVAPLASTALQVASSHLSRVELSRRHGRATRTTVTLEKRADGWWLAAPVEYRASRFAVESIVPVLAEILILSSDPAGEDGARKHWVDDAQGIEVKAWTGGRLASHFVVGRSHREMTFLRVVGDERIHSALGRCRPIFDKTVDDLRNAVITNYPASQIQRVRYSSPDGVLELVADPAEPGRFVPRGRPIRNFHHERASQSVGVLAHLLAKGFVEATETKREGTRLFDEDTPRATLFVRDEAGRDKAIQVWVGARSSSGLLYVRTSETGQIYLVSAHLETSLVPRRRHFERSDEMMAELRERWRARERAGTRDGGAGSHDHDHSPPPADEVPPELMRALRGLAREQRNRR